MAITNKDIEKLSGVFVTKEDSKAFATNEDIRELRGEFLGRFDKLFKKMEDMTIEMKMSYYQSREQGDKIENHEKRLVLLEARA